MVEGFEQGTDRAFANYLTYSKASLAEVLKRLKRAYFKKHITADELEARLVAGEELGKMLGGFIKYCAAAIGRIGTPITQVQRARPHQLASSAWDLRIQRFVDSRIQGFKD